MALAAWLVERVRAELATGQRSIRGIARSVGVSRGTVLNVKHRRGRYDPARARRLPDVTVDPDGPVTRCKCGLLVRQPCLACQLAEMARQPAPGGGTIRIEPLGLKLVGEDRDRYEEVHARMLGRLADRRSEPATLEPLTPLPPNDNGDCNA